MSNAAPGCLRLAVLMCVLLTGWSWAGLAQALSFDAVTITLGDNDRIILDAQIDYELNETASDALENGVPLTFETHIQMREVGAWMWQSDVAEFRVRNVLRYRPLSGLYEVLRVGTDDKQVFATRASALRFMGRISELALIERSQLNLSAEYLVRLRTYLDIEALPLPMRPMAYISPEWEIESEPWEWQLRP